MTTERAIEILNPEHREHYESIEIVEEACRLGMAALEKQTPKKPIYVENIALTDVYKCPCCKKRFTGTSIAKHCYHCGQALDWA